MTCNCRVIKHHTIRQGLYAVNERFYNEKGTIMSWTENPIDLVGNNKKVFAKILQLITYGTEILFLKEADLLKMLRKRKT